MTLTVEEINAFQFSEIVKRIDEVIESLNPELRILLLIIFYSRRNADEYEKEIAKLEEAIIPLEAE